MRVEEFSLVKRHMSAREHQLLLVDDDPSAIHAMRALLTDFPNQRFAVSGQDALVLARASRPDLILLDMNLPGMSGLDVCDALRADPRLANIPIIMATAHDRTELEVLALERGAADFVSKPLQPEQFRARVRAQLHANRASTSARPDLFALAPPPLLAIPDIPRLLIVDDDVAAIHFIRSTLEKQGNFYYATTGSKALELARSILPDLILLDAHIPGMDGFEVCKSLQAQPALKNIPIVFITRYCDPVNEARALDLGAADFVSKPYTPAVLQARVRNLLELKRRNDAELQSVGERWRQLGDARVTDIVQAASDAIVSSDGTGTIVLANSAAGDLFGVSQEQLIGRPMDDLMSDVCEPLERLGHAPVRVVVRRADGRTVAAEASISRLDKEGLRLTTLVFRDVSDRERLEAHARARAAAEAANLTKSRMLSYIAHEMGNPLNGLLGFMELMHLDARDPLPPQQAKRLDLATGCAKSLQALLRDLLDMGRRENAEFSLECAKVDIAAVVEAAVEAVSAIAARAEVAVRFTAPAEPAHAMADAQRLQQCLVNLLTNAIKYNVAGGWAEVSLTLGPERIGLAVHDNGMGMTDTQRAKLFQPFNRLGREDNPNAQGTGLGLVITRQLVETMNGRMFVDSTVGAGSCFTISLPRVL